MGVLPIVNVFVELGAEVHPDLLLRRSLRNKIGRNSLLPVIKVALLEKDVGDGKRLELVHRHWVRLFGLPHFLTYEMFATKLRLLLAHPCVGIEFLCSSPSQFKLSLVPFSVLEGLR